MGVKTETGAPVASPPRLGPALGAEFLGTALLVLLGDGVVAADVLLRPAPDPMTVTTAWGLAVALGVYLSGRLSGGHLNPAVTLALAARGEFPRGRLVPYWAAQLAGAFVGAWLVYADYAEAFRAFERKEGLIRGAMEGGKLVGRAAGGAGVFATYPAFDVLGRNLLSEFLATAVLLVGVRALTDRRNAAPGGYVEPLALGALVWAIGLSLGGLTGYAINPARDLGPRLASALLGWGPAVFRSHGGYFWVPLVVPLAGGVAGATLYDLVIRGHLPPSATPSPPGELSP
ncbi:MAG TPA: MIP/aquaporin family protein [Isosphaeraceae bacterium]|jgi:glycerol uptake facilitator protein|nr:MIP/aquaporin family protein [Isosphaeraceae bacterium]